MLRKSELWLSALVALSPAAVFAHSVWIEPSENRQPVIRFAEPSGNLERSPGHLDSLSVPMAFQTTPGSTNVPTLLNISKQKDHYAISGASGTNIIGVETSFTVRAGRKPCFYARWQPAGAGEGKPLLTLDLVPTGQSGEARLYLRGQPRGGVKATLMTPNGEEKEFTTDADGYLRVPTTEPGLYLLTVAHQREPIAGVHLGVVYKETSHNCSLAWEQAK
ncbi:MAG: hypothetical protein QM813_22205 [Verrucomicrobiota bacterium]